jgi:poly-gamma-glutamate system protein
MKKIYWRPRSVSRTALLLLAVASLVALWLVERRQFDRQRPFYEEKMAAATRAQAAIEAIGDARRATGVAIDRELDPAGSGLVGVAMSRVTSVPGDLVAKQTTVNPNFAAAIVEMLRQAGVERGDRIAVGVSGSFPALNICVYAAAETIGAEPIVIASASASQFGANVESLLWTDMERLLAEKQLLRTRSVAASLGGFHDSAKNLSPAGIEIIRKSLAAAGVPLMNAGSFDEMVDERIQIFRNHAAGAPIKAYINVGGGSASVGRRGGKHQFAPGLNLKMPPGVVADGVMERFSEQRVPVIHLIQVVELARRYGLPIAPTSVPAPGEGAAEGNVYVAREYDRLLAFAALAAILAAMYGLVRSDLAFRIFRSRPANESNAAPQRMV